MSRPSLKHYAENARNEYGRVIAAAALDQGLPSVRALAKLTYRDHKSVLAHMNMASLPRESGEEYARLLGLSLDGKVARALRRARVDIGADRLTDDDLFRYGLALLQLIALQDRCRDFVEATQRISEALRRASPRVRRRSLHPFAKKIEGGWSGLLADPGLWRAASAACEAVGVRLEACRNPPKFLPIFDLYPILERLRPFGLDEQGQQAVLDTLHNALGGRTRGDDAAQRGSFWYALAGRDTADRYEQAVTFYLVSPLDVNPRPPGAEHGGGATPKSGAERRRFGLLAQRRAMGLGRATRPLQN
jgi:hypothetical protein